MHRKLVSMRRDIASGFLSKPVLTKEPAQEDTPDVTLGISMHLVQIRVE